jgi:hypothetical protein
MDGKFLNVRHSVNLLEAHRTLAIAALRVHPAAKLRQPKSSNLFCIEVESAGRIGSHVAWDKEAIAFLRKHREYVLRDLKTLESGALRITDPEGGATSRWIGRYQRQLVYLDDLIAAYEQRSE